MYGPGVYLRTNAQGFRNSHDIPTAVPSGKARVICSGDSFTLGYGVDNAHTWCELLSSLEPRLETVNMGQGGYGVDQAYLWYKRDTAKIEHQVQILAFITNDFARMLSDSFAGYPKPVPELENGTLMVKNVPVPKLIYYFPLNPLNIQNLRQLRTFEFLNRALQKLGGATTDSSQLTTRERNEKAQEVLYKIFEDLKRTNEQRSSQLVLVYLPRSYELQGEGPREWTAFLEEESRSLGIPFINLFSEFRSLPENDIVKLYTSNGQLAYRSAEGHFNEAGNELVARAIYDKLMKDPAISYALSARWNHRQPAHQDQGNGGRRG
jgi:lysophospholipase L1-like esterase